MENQSSISSKIKQTVKLLQQEIDNKNKDNVCIHLWSLDILFDKYKNNQCDFLSGTADEEEIQKALQSYKSIEGIVHDIKNFSERFLTVVNSDGEDHLPMSSRHSTSPDVSHAHVQDNNMVQERLTASCQHCSTIYHGLPTPSRHTIEASNTSESRYTSATKVVSESLSKCTDAPTVSASVSSHLSYRELSLEIQRRKAHLDQEMKYQMKEQARRQAEEKRTLRLDAEEETQKLEKELQRLIDEANQQKRIRQEKRKEEKQEMKRRHQEEKRRLEIIRQDIEFQTEQELIHAEKNAYGYEDESINNAYEMHKKRPTIDIHEIRKAALPMNEHKTRIKAMPLPTEPHETELSTQPLLNGDHTNTENQCRKNTENIFLNKIIDTMQAPPAEIMIFDGNPLQYNIFIKAFDNAVHSRSFDDNAKLTRLVTYCKGEPRSLVESCMIMDASEGYYRARHILQKRYGDKFTITKACTDKLLDRQQLKAKDAAALQKYADDLRICKVTLDTLGPSSTAEMNASSSLARVFEKLPDYLKGRWRSKLQEIKLTRKPDFEDMVLFVEKAAEEANDPVYGLRAFDRNQGTALVTHIKTTQASNKSCPACQKDHHIFSCVTFRNMKVTERIKLANEKKLCLNCLKPGHRSTECYSERSCPIQNCGQKHTVFLHLDNHD